MLQIALSHPFVAAFVPPEERNGVDANRRGALAREAEPLRRSLTRFFQRRVRQGADVEDLVQEVFTRIVARDSTRPVEHLAGYVFQTAANVLADRGRQRLARHADTHIEFDPEQHGRNEIDPERILSGKDRLRVANAALLSLPERTRTIFILHRLEGYRHREIAEQLGITVSAVEKQIIKAVQHLTKATKRGS